MVSTPETFEAEGDEYGNWCKDEDALFRVK